jgi:hypothetical protein
MDKDKPKPPALMGKEEHFCSLRQIANKSGFTDVENSEIFAELEAEFSDKTINE